MPGTPKSVLILGGTKEAAEIADSLLEMYDWRVISSLAGRTRSPHTPAGEIRTGGFGGTTGLAEFLEAEAIDLLVDATHPFATNITRNALLAAEKSATPLIRLERPSWEKHQGDVWTSVNSEQEACAAIPANARVFLALGRQHVDAFTDRGDVHFVLRMVDRPDTTLAFANCELVVGRPGQDAETEAAVLRDHGITHLVCRNSGGSAAYAKIVAARNLSIPVIMIERPDPPGGQAYPTVDALMDAIA